MDARDMAFLVVSMLFITGWDVMANTGWAKFEIEPKYTGVYCPGQSVVHDDVNSDLLCAYTASLTEGCIGFFFNTITGVCSTATNVPAIVSSCQPQNGSLYFKKKVCDTPAALVNGENRLPDSKITATTEYYIWHTKHARLDSTKGWAANIQNQQQYIQFDLRSTKIVTKIITQGSKRPVKKNGPKNAWVKSYKLHYSTDCRNYTEYNQVFGGNRNHPGRVSNKIYPVIVARCVRVNPQTWSEMIGMRIEMMGCLWSK